MLSQNKMQTYKKENEQLNPEFNEIIHWRRSITSTSVYFFSVGVPNCKFWDESQQRQLEPNGKRTGKNERM